MVFGMSISLSATMQPLSVLWENDKVDTLKSYIICSNSFFAIKKSMVPFPLQVLFAIQTYCPPRVGTLD